ncbi:MAG: hypothetical protein ACJA0Q_000886 [Saprospiraceae bacterium]|jgi:hypothetical protein
MRFYTYILVLLMTSNILAQEPPKFLFKSVYGPTVNSSGNLLLFDKSRDRAFGIYDLQKDKVFKTKKLGKEFKAAAAPLSIGDRWVYLSNPLYPKMAKASYTVIELDERGKMSYSAPFFDCEEKLGSYKFYGLTSTTSQVAFRNRMTKSKNEKYILSVASKIYGGQSMRESLNISLKDYRKSNEVVQFALMNSKLEVVKKGSYDANLTRGYVERFQFFVSSIGDIYFVYILRQEFVGKSNRIIIVKVPGEGESVEKVIFNLPKFNTTTASVHFTDDKIQLMGIAELFSKDDQGKVEGIYYAEVNLSSMNIDKSNVIVFSQKQKDKLNQIYSENESALVKREDNSEIFPQIQGSIFPYGDGKMGFLMRYDVPVKTAGNVLTPGYVVGHSYSSYFLMRLGADQKSILDITSFKNANGQSDKGCSFVTYKNDKYFLYSEGRICYGVKIPSDGTSSIKKEIKIGAMGDFDLSYTFRGGSGIQIKDSPEYYFSMSYVNKKGMIKSGVARMRLNFE